MFTGIVQAIGAIEQAAPAPGGALRLRVRTPWTDLEPGESVAADGVCLTVAALPGDGRFDADASAETLARSTLRGADSGRAVHLERALRFSDRLGGHLLAGHVDAVGRIEAAREIGGGVRRLTVRVPPALAPQIAPKGSIAIDGVSLTVNEVRGDAFDVMVVPHTARATRLGAIAAGTPVNVETDVLAKYVARALGGGGEGVTADLLARCGFGGSGERG
jgi:riboflavin synthase